MRTQFFFQHDRLHVHLTHRRVFDVFIVALRRLRYRLAIDGQFFIAVFNRIAWQSHDALNKTHAFIFRISKHHHVATANIVDRNNHIVGDGHAYAVIEFVHQNKVAHHQTRSHRAGRDLKWLCHKGSEHKHNKDDGEKTTHVINKMAHALFIRILLQYFARFFVFRQFATRQVLLGLALYALADAPNHARQQHEYQQHGGERQEFGQHAKHPYHHQQIAPLQSV